MDCKCDCDFKARPGLTLFLPNFALSTQFAVTDNCMYSLHADSYKPLRSLFMYSDSCGMTEKLLTATFTPKTAITRPNKLHL